MNPGGLNSTELREALGDVNERIERARVADAKHDDVQRYLSYLPTAPDSTEQRAAAEASAQDAEQLAQRAVECVRQRQEEIATAEVGLHVARRALSTADQAHAAEVEQEERDFAAGLSQTSANPAQTKAVADAARRRVDVLERALADVKAPLSMLQAEATAAQAKLSSARVEVARTRRIEHATRLREIVKAQVAFDEEHRRAVGALTDSPAKQGAILKFRKTTEQITREVAPIISEEARATLPSAPRQPAPGSPEENNVLMYVRAGHNYGGAKSGERVHVSEAEAMHQTRTNPMNDERLGALETPAEFEARQFEAHRERERPRSIVSAIKQTVEEGIARFSVEARAKRAERDAEDQRARSDRDLGRLLAQQLLEQNQE